MSENAPVGHVYVHAPFCSRRCVYCDFAVHVSAEPESDRWIEAIETEVRLLQDGGIVVSPDLQTLYIGGGTPSLLRPQVFSRLGALLGTSGGPTLEWTAEANPESFTDEVAAGWADAGVNRVSFGVQSFSPEALRWMGRLHTPEDASAGVARARKAGIANLSADLIFGLPDSVSRSWQEDLERVLGLEVSHVSLYGLTVEKGTPLDLHVAHGRMPWPSEGRYRDEFLLAAEVMTAAGYVHYEVSNFALPGKESRNNRAYWATVPYLGLGNGAHSYARGRRWWNHRAWTEYVEAVEEGRSPVSGQETLSDEQSDLERLWLALRTAEGCRCPPPGSPAEILVVDWKRRGIAAVEGGRLRLSTEGWLLLDELVVEMDAVLDRHGESEPRR